MASIQHQGDLMGQAPAGVVQKGRGATLNPAGRFESLATQAVDDGWSDVPPDLGDGVSWRRPEAAKSILTRNQSPDVPFDRSINPYRGCEHGCVYCFARPAHSFVNLSPGFDFEAKIFFKENAAQLLEQTLARPGYRCAPIALGTNTDPWQPAERQLAITRSLLEVLLRHNHPVTIVTKSALIERDIDLLAQMAQRGLVFAQLSLTTLNNSLKRQLEPRTASPSGRLRALERLHAAGIPTGVICAPLIPMINDHELEDMLAAARDVGVQSAAYILLRLPYEVKTLFRDWLANHYPDRARRVMSLVRSARGGRDNDPRFGSRMRGQGVYAELINQRFHKACRDLGLSAREKIKLDTSQFRVPANERQFDLF